jgi:hypothetical protein
MDELSHPIVCMLSHRLPNIASGKRYRHLTQFRFRQAPSRSISQDGRREGLTRRIGHQSLHLEQLADGFTFLRKTRNNQFDQMHQLDNYMRDFSTAKKTVVMAK